MNKIIFFLMAAVAIGTTNVVTNVAAGPIPGAIVKTVSENVPWTNNDGIIITTTTRVRMVVGSSTPANVALTVVGGMTVDSITVTGVMVSSVPTTFNSTATFNATAVFNSSIVANGRIGIQQSNASAPGIYNINQVGTGMYYRTNETGWSINGSTFIYASAAGVQVPLNLFAEDVILGGTGATGAHQAGSLRIFTTSANKGSVLLTASDNAGATTTTENWAAQGGARTYTHIDFGASANYAISTSTGPKYLLQTPVQCSVSATSGTATTSFINTLSTCAITPTQATSLIRVSISGDLASNSGTPGTTVAATLARNGTNILGTAGFAVAESQTAGLTVGMVPASLPGYYDNPATTSQVLYTVQIKVISGTTTAQWCQPNQSCRITLEEIGQ